MPITLLLPSLNFVKFLPFNKFAKVSALFTYFNIFFDCQIKKMITYCQQYDILPDKLNAVIKRCNKMEICYEF